MRRSRLWGPFGLIPFQKAGKTVHTAIHHPPSRICGQAGGRGQVLLSCRGFRPHLPHHRRYHLRGRPLCLLSEKARRVSVNILQTDVNILQTK